MESSTNNSEITLGTQVDGRYEIVEILYKSDLITLARAIDTTLNDESILIKFFYYSDGSLLNKLERFRSELLLTRRLSHPNIAGVYDLGRYLDRYFYITLQDVSGISIEDYILGQPKNHIIPFPIILKIFYQSIEALKEVHKRKIIHRNLTSSNIVIDINNEELKSLYITNFGVGSFIDKNLNLTKTGEIPNFDPTYQPPEKLLGQILDPRADIFSLGIIMHELISCNLLHDNKSNIPLNTLMLHQNLPDLKSIRNDIPNWFIEIITKMVHADKNKRFNSTEEIRLIILEKTWGDPVQNELENKKDFSIKSFLANLTIATILILLIFFQQELRDIIFTSFTLEESSEKLEQEIFKSVETGNESELFKLIDKLDNLKIKDNLKNPLINIAVNKKDLSVAYTLLRHSPHLTLEIDDQGLTPLHHAVKNNDIEMVELLIKNGKPSLDIKDNNGLTALDYAKEAGLTGMISTLAPLFKSQGTGSP